MSSSAPRWERGDRGPETVKGRERAQALPDACFPHTSPCIRSNMPSECFPAPRATGQVLEKFVFLWTDGKIRRLSGLSARWCVRGRGGEGAWTNSVCGAVILSGSRRRRIGILRPSSHCGRPSVSGNCCPGAAASVWGTAFEEESRSPGGREYCVQHLRQARVTAVTVAASHLCHVSLPE